MFNLFSKPKPIPIIQPIAMVEATPNATQGQIKSLWRNNMWVMTPKGVGVLFQLGEPCVVHLTHANGTFDQSWQFPSAQLRQALWDEIPEPRRACTREHGLYLGYA